MAAARAERPPGWIAQWPLAKRSMGCGRKNVIGRTGETGVDEAEAIRLANQVAIDESQASELIGVGGDRCGFHPDNSMRTACLRSTIRAPPLPAVSLRSRGELDLESLCAPENAERLHGRGGLVEHPAQSGLRIDCHLSMATIRSPLRMPASSAIPPVSTACTRTPGTSGSPTARRRSRAIPRLQNHHAVVDISLIVAIGLEGQIPFAQQPNQFSAIACRETGKQTLLVEQMLRDYLSPAA